MTDVLIDDTALRDEIAHAESAWRDAMEALNSAPVGEFAERMAEYQRASQRHSALIEAGLILTLGTGENTDGEIQP